MRIALSLSANVVAAPERLCDHPSGTLTENPPPGGENGTNAWLSGMSPAGLVSGALGLAGRGLELPQPASSAATTPARITNVRMRATVRTGGQRASGARSTPGQNARARRSGSYAWPVSGAAILLVEDDDAIASGLVRVLESQGFATDRLARGGPAPRAGGGGTRVGVPRPRPPHRA